MVYVHVCVCAFSLSVFVLMAVYFVNNFNDFITVTSLYRWLDNSDHGGLLDSFCSCERMFL